MRLLPAGGTDTDIALVVAEANRNWVLDSICRRAAEQLSESSRVCYLPGDLPRARGYFFSHWSLALGARRRHGLPRGSRVVAFFTHPRDIGLSSHKLVRELNRCDAIMSMSSTHAHDLVAAGVDAHRITTVLAASDPAMFHPGATRGDLVGLVSAYYDRKEPGRVLELVRALPHREFVLVGKGWDESPIGTELGSLPNLSVIGASYEQYPDLYRRMAVFVSPSSVEGGPIPLLEAMLTGVTPVATRTGFAPDIIEHGRNGYLCDTDVDGPALAALVEAAIARPGRGVRESVEHLTWARFARLLSEAVLPPGPHGTC